MRLEARTIVVHGRVQAVGFRVFARHEALRLGVHGWVRNLSSGRSVEAFAQGEKPTLDAFREALRRGPPGGHVASVEETAAPTEPGLIGFEIRV